MPSRSRTFDVCGVQVSGHLYPKFISLHMLLNFSAPDLSHFSVRLALYGLKRQRLEIPAKIRPFPSILHAIFKNFQSPAPRAPCFLDSRLGGNFVPCSKAPVCFGTAHQACGCACVTLYLTVPVLKTNRFLGKCITVPLRADLNSVQCPVTALDHLNRDVPRFLAPLVQVYQPPWPLEGQQKASPIN